MRRRHVLKTLRLVGIYAVGLAAALLQIACESTSATAPTTAFLLKGKLTNLTVDGSVSLLFIGQTSPLTAKVTTPQGRATVTDRATWTSADPSVATVTPGGVVTATGFGVTAITARLDELLVTRSVSVVAATALTIAGSGPDGNTLRSGILALFAVNRTAQMTLTATWPDGVTRNVTGEAAWNSLNPAIASISPNGVLRSIGFGETSLVASYQSLTLTTKVTVEPSLTLLFIRGNTNLTASGETRAFTAVARFSDGSERDVSTEATWTTSNPSVATVSPAGILTAIGFGRASIGVTYLNRQTSVDVNVSPPGTFVVSGRVYDPGDFERVYANGLPGFAVRDLQTGASTTTDATGDYTLAGVAGGDRMRFEKEGWETVERVMDSDDISPFVHPINRIAAGATTAFTIEQYDVQYDLPSGVRCDPCRLIRVVSTTPGTLHLQLRWTQLSVVSPTVKLRLFANGQTFSATTTSPLETVADVTVALGETLIYAGVIGDPPNHNSIQVTLATSLVALPDASSNRPPHKEQ